MKYDRAPDGNPWNLDSDGNLRPLPADCWMGFQGQLITHDFDQLRRYCISQPARQQAGLAVLVRGLMHAPMRHGSFSKIATSYGLKHVAEKISDEFTNLEGAKVSHEYVSNEDLIIAMVQAGFKARNVAPADCRLSNHYFFNVSTPALRACGVQNNPTRSLDAYLKKGGLLVAEAETIFRNTYGVSHA